MRHTCGTLWTKVLRSGLFYKCAWVCQLQVHPAQTQLSSNTQYFDDYKPPWLQLANLSRAIVSTFDLPGQYTAAILDFNHFQIAHEVTICVWKYFLRVKSGFLKWYLTKNKFLFGFNKQKFLILAAVLVAILDFSHPRATYQVRFMARMLSILMFWSIWHYMCSISNLL